MSPPGRQSLRPAGGFTLLELTLVLLALGLGVYIAATEIGKFQRRAKIDQLVVDLRKLGVVFENYRQQKGAWPPATNPDIRTPLGMETFLADTPWQSGPPIGGTYEWQPPARPAGDDKEVESRPAYIAITAFSPSPPLALTMEDLRYIDTKLDDGNLATGRFRTGFNGWPIFRVEGSP